MSNDDKKEWYAALYGCYFEKNCDGGNIEIIDPTLIRKVVKEPKIKYFPSRPQDIPVIIINDET